MQLIKDLIIHVPFIDDLRVAVTVLISRDLGRNKADEALASGVLWNRGREGQWSRPDQR